MDDVNAKILESLNEQMEGEQAIDKYRKLPLNRSNIVVAGLE